MMRPGLRKTSMALPSRRFSGEQANDTVRPFAWPAKACSKRRDGADGKLRRDQHYRAILQVREQRFHLPADRIGVGAVVFIDRRIVADPYDIGIRRRRDVGAEGEGARGDAVTHQFGKARLKQRRLAGRELFNPR